ncbi:MAG: hypothetical protein JWP81_5164 [Ferruginibacter sp.]|nr:hypothetical protein [Ferruginibacter sp.]
MNNTFSIKRFKLLFRKTIAERPVQTIGVMALLLVLSLILYVAAKELAGFNAAQNLSFIWGLAGGGFFMASFVFGYFGTNASGSSYLTLPASYLEKWLCGILIAGVLYLIIFLLFYHLMDIAFVEAYHHSLDPSSLSYKQQYDSVYPFDLTGRIAGKVYAMFLMLAGAMFTGALYFNKSAFIKTAIFCCSIFLVLFGLNWLTATMLFGHINDAGLYNHVTLPLGKEEATLLMPASTESLFLTTTLYIIPAVLWLLPLIRLREKEF